MAKKSRTRKITDTLVSQLSEEQPKPQEEKKETPKKKKEVSSKKISSSEKVSSKASSYDSETSGINYSIGGFL